ncbi:MAG: tyrosyl-tRNA synthetase, partial [Mycoplasmataceae bacterium CE_OT135]
MKKNNFGDELELEHECQTQTEQSNQIKSNQIKSNQIKSNQIKSN